MKQISDVLPWRVTDISLRPFKGMWSFNPSLHFDGRLWRCVLRCADYAMPDGVTVRGSRARPEQARTKNALVIFAPDSWKPIEIFKMRERDEAPRVSSASLGYEDIRIFVTDKGGLQGIAASLHLRRDPELPSKIPEQVLLSFDDNYDIVRVQPIRGAWSSTPQKNWVPFDRVVEPRFLHAIGPGSLFDDRGPLHEGVALVQPSTRRLRVGEPDDGAIERARKRAKRVERARRREFRRRSRAQPSIRDAANEGSTSSQHVGLRGGTQLVRVGADVWLGVGHEMKFVGGKKYYWHVWYVVDARGRMRAVSPPMKLVPNGIEFAAGLAIDGDRVVVSFGVDDMECRVGETKLPAVLAMLDPCER